MEQLAKHKDKNVVLQTYDKTGIAYLGVWNITIEHKDKKGICIFFVLPGNGPALLVIPDIEMLDNTIDL